MVTLQNVARRMLSFNLAHPSLLEGSGKHKYKTIHTIVVDQDRRSGALSARRLPRNVPESLTLAAHEIVHDLPNVVLECPEVKAALGKKLVRVLSTSKDEPPPQAAPADDEDADAAGDDR